MGNRIAHIKDRSPEGIWKCRLCGRSRVPREGERFYEVTQSGGKVVEHLFIDDGQELPQGFTRCRS